LKADWGSKLQVQQKNFAEQDCFLEWNRTVS
jgi:hypothetical protein